MDLNINSAWATKFGIEFKYTIQIVAITTWMT